MKRELILSIIAVSLFAGQSCKKAFEDSDEMFDPNAGNEIFDNANNNEAVLDGIVSQVVPSSPYYFEFDNDTPNRIIGKKTLVEVQGSGSVAEGSLARITKSGNYIVEGQLSNGGLEVDLDKADTGTVKLIFNNLDFASVDGAALRVKTASRVSILLKDGTVNKLSSTASADSLSTIQSSQDVFFSSGDLKSGALEVYSKNFQAIKTTDGIAVKSGKFKITSENNDGIQAKDFISIDGGSFEITAAQHALKATSEKENKGFIYISGGDFDLKSTYKETATTSEVTGKDAIHAVGSINILNGKFKISSYGDGIYSNSHLIIKNGDFTVVNSNKCISAVGNIQIDGGNFTLTPNAKKISQEQGFGHGITVKKSDSGIRLGNVVINGGNINITQSYEGIQGANITINDGVLKVYSFDDAINASDGQSQMGGGFGPGRPGRPGFGATQTQSSNIGLTFNGGFTMVVTQGDGIDSNGELSINGGVVLVSQSGSGNEPIDAGDGYQPKITGGVVIAVGSMGMASAPSCSQTSLFASASGSQNNILAINDSNGNNIAAWKVPQAYQVMTISAPELTSGKYTYITNAQVSGDEYVAGSGFYYPAASASGSGTSVTLTKGTCTSTNSGFGGR